MMNILIKGNKAYTDSRWEQENLNKIKCASSSIEDL